ncbi:MAG: hypothetical protein F6K21_33730 [Symploca sp. SIO2D2]|nr:hypothetical protein [Symploca sp. SIO2D2]
MADRALVIGINSYHRLRSLKYAERDAALMRDFFANEAKFEEIFYYSDNSPEFIAPDGSSQNTQPTYANLWSFLLDFFEEPELEPGDNFWFFFSGHGIRHQDRDYLMPCDVNPRAVEATAISINYIIERLRRCGADNVVLLLDACRNEGSKSGLGIEMETHQGVVTIFSCAPSEKSYEIEEIEQGAFTYALLESLRIQGEGNCATVERLYKRLRYRVTDINHYYGKTRQTPYAIAEPASKYHLILLPRQATEQDIATLREDALYAEVEEEDYELAEHLWTRVLALSPADPKALKSLKRIWGKSQSTAKAPLSEPTPESGDKSKTITPPGYSEEAPQPPLPQVSKNKSGETSQQIRKCETHQTRRNEIPRKILFTPLPQKILNLHSLASESPEMIASYLQEPLRSLGVSVTVITQNQPEVSAEQAAEVTEKKTTDKSQPSSVNQRLWVICNSDYSPDSSLLMDLLIEQLRNLRLSGFRDAAICSQVSGEAAPEWMVRVDLTPPEVMLKDWAHWGDVQAIAWMLNQTLASQGLLVRALQKESQLHVFCRVLVPQKKVTPKQETAVKLIQPLLESLAPQGIQGATIYGVESDYNSLAPEQEQLAWIDWLNLPAADKQSLASSAYDLAKQGNPDALTFLLERLLNQDLERRLATGGIQVKIRRKQNLLYVMSEAPVCPPKAQVGSPVTRFILELAIPEIVGVRVFGRRAGYTSPSWNHGVNFVHRSRQVPEAAPEFAPSDAHLHEPVAHTEAIQTNKAVRKNIFYTFFSKILS